MSKPKPFWPLGAGAIRPQHRPATTSRSPRPSQRARAQRYSGALGLTDDTVLATFYAHERSARIYDGPDEVHKVAAAKRILKRHAPPEAGLGLGPGLGSKADPDTAPVLDGEVLDLDALRGYLERKLGIHGPVEVAPVPD